MDEAKPINLPVHVKLLADIKDPYIFDAGAGFVCQLFGADAAEAAQIAAALNATQEPPAQTEGSSGSAGEQGDSGRMCSCVECVPDDPPEPEPTPQRAGKQWTREVPTEAGWYFTRGFCWSSPAVFVVYRDGKNVIGLACDGQYMASSIVDLFAANPNMEWFGPLEPGEGE